MNDAQAALPRRARPALTLAVMEALLAYRGPDRGAQPPAHIEGRHIPAPIGRLDSHYLNTEEELFAALAS